MLAGRGRVAASLVLVLLAGGAFVPKPFFDTL
jgi:hypothetical protein